MSNNIINTINNDISTFFGGDKTSGVQSSGQQTGASAQNGNVTLNNAHGAGKAHSVSNSQNLSERITSAFSAFFQEVAENINAAGEKLGKFVEDVKSALKFLEDRWGTTSTSYKKALKGFFERLCTAFKNLIGKTVSNQVSHGFREISEGNLSEGAAQIGRGLQQGFEQVAQRAENVFAGIRHAFSND